MSDETQAPATHGRRKEREGVVVQRAEVISFEGDSALIRRFEPRDHVEQRGLPDPGVADDGDVLPGGKLQGNAVEDDSFAEALGDPLQAQHA